MPTENWQQDPEQALANAIATVLGIIDRLRDDGTLTDEAANRRADDVAAAPDLFSLDEYVYRDKILKKRVCSRVFCFNPPRPPRTETDDDAPRRGGNPPAYCTERDADGIGHDNVQHSWELRQRLRNAGPAKTPVPHTDTGRGPTALTGPRPWTAARTTFAQHVQRIGERLDQLVAEHSRLAPLLQAALDDDTRNVEIQAITAEAQRRVEEEAGLRLRAYQEAEQLRNANDGLTAELDDAVDAAEAALAEAAEARAELHRFRQDAAREIAEARATAQWLAAEARWRADTDTAAARAAFDQDLRQRTEQMRRTVADAETARDAALAEAGVREREADAAVAAATRTVAVAEAARDEHKADAEQLRRNNTELHDAALAREREFEQTLARLHRDHDVRTTALRADIEQLRARHDHDLTERLAQQRADLDRLHQAEVSALTTTIELLRRATPPAPDPDQPPAPTPDTSPAP